MICLALNQRETRWTIAHGQQNLLQRCSPVSLGAARRHGWGKQGTLGGSRVSTGQRVPRHVGVYKTSLITPPATGEIGRMSAMTVLVKRAAPAIATAFLPSLPGRSTRRRSGFPGWWHRYSSQEGNQQRPELVGCESLRDALLSHPHDSWLYDFPTPPSPFPPTCWS